MNTLQQINQWVADGWNRSDVMQALELSDYQLRVLCASLGGVKWSRRTIAFRNYVENRRTWVSGAPHCVAAAARMRAARDAKRPKFTVAGVTGTLRQLSLHFHVVSHESVLYRIKRGWSVEAAVLTPRTDR